MSARIDRVQTWTVHYPTQGHFKFFQAPPGKPACRSTVVVKLTDQDGATGWGQAVPSPRWSYETLETVQSTLTRYLTPALLGLDAEDETSLFAAMNAAIAPGFSTGQPICKAAVDLARIDLVARRRQRSAADLLGRVPRPSVNLSWTLNPTALAEVEPAIAEAQARGYRHFNLKVAPDPKFDLELCRLTRRLAPQAFLWADANGGYDEPAARSMLGPLAELGFAALEQPLPANRLSGYGRLKRRGALPILMDEGLVSEVDLAEFIALDLLDGAVLKVARCGGLGAAWRQAELLEQAGLMILGSGLTDPDLSLAASLTLLACFDLAGPAALNAPQYLRGSLLRGPLSAEAGAISTPPGPGLGVEVDERLLQSAPEGGEIWL